MKKAMVVKEAQNDKKINKNKGIIGITTIYLF